MFSSLLKKPVTTSIYSGAIIVGVLFFFVSAIPSSGQEFGKNKVQYREFDWKFIQSNHFDIYFYDEAGRNLATFTSYVAEDALSSIQEHLRFTITDRISLVIYNSKNDFQQTNVVNAYMPEGVGGVTELFKNRVVVPFEGNWEQFRHVIHHELVHAVLNDKFYGGSIQSIIQNNIEVELPIWMNEGLAEFEGHDGYNVETDMFIRDAVIGEYMPELYQMNGYFAYRGGQAFYWYVAENYGRDKIGELLDRVKSSSSLDAAFKGAFGKGLEDFSEQFLYDLKKIYWPDITDRKRPRDFARALTDHKEEESFMNASPSISPDGLKVAFISDRDGPRSVYLMELDDPSNVRELVQGERNVEFEELHLLSPAIAWSPDSRRVAIAVKSKGKDAIFLIDVKSGERTKLEFDLDAIYSVDWSSNGEYLAFQGIKGDMSDIYTYELKKKELRNITDDLYSDFDPKWSEDSETLYFLSDRKDNPIRSAKGLGYKIWNYDYRQIDIYSINVTSLDLERITSDDAVEKTPTPGPDGSLFYVSDKNGIYNIYVVDKSGGEAQAITNSITGIEQLTITPDGSRLVFSAWNGRGYDIFQLLAPLELKLPEGEVKPTTFLKRDKVEVDSTAEEDDESFTVVTEVEGYDDVKIDLGDAMVTEPPADRVKPKTYTKPADPPPGAV
ncbi:MAG: biopolymer transporter Tol, partial [Candidatus Kapaibacterium sp.]